MLTFRKAGRLRALGVAVGGVASLALVLALGTVSPASAATADRLDVCAKGNYEGEVNLGYYAVTPIAAPGGRCVSLYVPHVANKWVDVEAIGFWNRSSGHFAIASRWVNISKGVTIDLMGTTGDKGKDAWVEVHQNQ
jgi:hypothetical protein